MTATIIWMVALTVASLANAIALWYIIYNRWTERTPQDAADAMAMLRYALRVAEEQLGDNKTPADIAAAMNGWLKLQQAGLRVTVSDVQLLQAEANMPKSSMEQIVTQFRAPPR